MVSSPRRQSPHRSLGHHPFCQADAGSRLCQHYDFIRVHGRTVGFPPTARWLTRPLIPPSSRHPLRVEPPDTRKLRGRQENRRYQRRAARTDQTGLRAAAELMEIDSQSGHGTRPHPITGVPCPVWRFTMEAGGELLGNSDGVSLHPACSASFFGFSESDLILYSGQHHT